MFGYACRETPELMPAPIFYAHRILKMMSEARKSGDTPELGPDAKSQVTVKYHYGKPVGVHSIVVSTQHAESRNGHALTSEDVREIISPIVHAALPEDWIDAETVWHVNPTGKFVIGGPDGDAGLTGRKIIVDTYGGAAPHGGGAFSGKDPTKVDRSAAYAARYLAKNVVAADLADRCTIQLSYAIGVSQPLSIYVDLHGTGKVEESRLEEALKDCMDLSPRGIRQHLGLNRPIYARTSAYGHFGRRAGGRRRLLLGEDRPGRAAPRRGALTGSVRPPREGTALEQRRSLHGRRKGKPLSARRTGLMADAYPALAVDLAAPPPAPLAALFPVPSTMSGSRSGSAAASISSPRRRPRRAPDSSASSPSSKAWRRRCRRSPTAGFGTSASTTATPSISSTGCRRHR